MTRTWSTPPEPTAVDHPDRVAEYDEQVGVERCSVGCVAIANAQGGDSDTDAHAFTCDGCGGSVCIGCRSTPVVAGGAFCTPCCNAHSEFYAGISDDVDVPSQEPMTAGQMRTLLEGVADDVPLLALFGPHLRPPHMQQWEIVATKHLLRGRPPEGVRAHYALYLRKTDR